MAQSRVAMVTPALVITAALSAMACGSPASLSVEAGIGPQPTLPVDADVRQEQVAGVPGALLGRELAAGRHQRGSCHGATLTTGAPRVPGRGITR